MRQSYWHQTGNLWALALSTVIALFLPAFGPDAVMDGGVGVVIRTTIVAPIVFSLLYWGGRLISYLTGRLIATLIGRLMEKLRMSIITAGIEQGLRDAANHRAKKLAPELARVMAQEIAQEAIQEVTSQATTAIQAASTQAITAIQAATAAQAAATGAQAAAADAQAAAEKAVKNRNADREAFIGFMRSKGVADEEIDAFIRRLTQQG